MKNFYKTPQSRIETALTPSIMQQFLGVATGSGGTTPVTINSVKGS